MSDSATYIPKKDLKRKFTGDHNWTAKTPPWVIVDEAAVAMHKAESAYEEAKTAKYTARMAYRAAKAACSTAEKACSEAKEAYRKAAAAYDEDLDSLIDVDQATMNFEASLGGLIVDHTNSLSLHMRGEEINDMSAEAVGDSQKTMPYSHDQSLDSEPNSPADSEEVARKRRERTRREREQKKKGKKAFMRAGKKVGTAKMESKDAAAVIHGDESQALAAGDEKDAWETEEDETKPTKPKKQKQKRARTETTQRWFSESSDMEDNDIDGDYGYGHDPWDGYEGPELFMGDPRDREVAEIMGMNPYAMDWF
ncbi:hypothetical protein LTR70_003540 [Exophiala xenobiotica]|uniref:Uncharacterized protein n=1 Tax=Lithohypha guttulata TaxID=1690604 RepID=A0ABR0KFV9_9EURO|nr:hypothetical protein LTR24_003088 [Lithohypha guttulata]KAK5322919.1 hypothetical protein LTR70_003540 [Exophiala xenobiotica]